MAPTTNRGGFIFRREEERKADEIIDSLDAAYRAGEPGAPRPTVSVVVAKLQAIRNHSLGRQKKRYLESLAEKLLDERTALAAAEAAAEAAAAELEAAAAAAAAAPAEGKSNGRSNGSKKTDDALPNEQQKQQPDTAMTTPPPTTEDHTPAMNGSDAPAADAEETVAAATVGDKQVRPRSVRSSRSRDADGSDRALRKRKRGAVGDRRAALRKRRRRDDASDSGSDSDSDEAADGDSSRGHNKKKRGAVVPTPILANGPTLEDFAGMDDLLDECLELVWMPLCSGGDFAATGCRPNGAILLYGPSGCGKTLLAHVLAAEVGVPFFSVSGPSLVGGISGESETNIRRIFDEALRQAPSLIFLDELEAIAGKQDAVSGRGPMEMRMSLTLADCLDRLGWGGGSSSGGSGGSGGNDHHPQANNVIVIAATNKADSLDPIVRRRFGVEKALRMPSQEARARILQTMTRGMRIAPDVDLAEIARMTPGFVGGDLHNVVTTAQRNYMRTVLDARLVRLRRAAEAEAAEKAQTDESNGAARMDVDADADADADVPRRTPARTPARVWDVRQDFRLLKAYRERPTAAVVAPAAEKEEAVQKAPGEEATEGEPRADPSADTGASTGNDAADACAGAVVTAHSTGDERLLRADGGFAGVTMEDFRRAAGSVLPAAKREGFSTIPNTTWSQVGAMAALREKLELSIIGPIRYPDKYAAVGLKPVGGILLWGPPGCGKTLVAKAVANESKANFISVRGPELLNKWVGESERALRELFERARAMAPCIIFFDEMDALAAKRDDARSDGSARIVNTLLTELDGVVDRTGLFVIGATNRPDIIDPALKRPGRLGESIFVGPPTADERVDILQTLYRNAIPARPAADPEAAAAEEDAPAAAAAAAAEAAEAAERTALLTRVARDPRCDGFSGADLDHLLRAAGRSSLKRQGLHGTELPRITLDDWEVALAETQPSTSPADLARYKKLQ